MLTKWESAYQIGMDINTCIQHCKTKLNNCTQGFLPENLLNLYTAQLTYMCKPSWLEMDEVENQVYIMTTISTYKCFLGSLNSNTHPIQSFSDE